MLKNFGMLYSADTLSDIQPGALLPANSKNYFLCLEDNTVYEIINNEVVKTSDFDFLSKESSDSERLVVVESKFVKRIETLEKRSAFLLSLISDKIIPPELYGGDN